VPFHANSTVDRLLPPGSIILTADQAETVRAEIETLCRNVNGGWRDGQPWDKETRAAWALLSPEASTE